ncbi:MAG: TRAP transporter small permease [Eubacteriaceae bacterium]
MKYFYRLQRYLCIFLIIFLVLVVFSSILARFIVFGVVFSEELGKYIYIWLAMMGIAVAAKDKAHIRVDFFANKIPINKDLLYIFSLVCFLIVTGFFSYLGLKNTIFHYQMGFTTAGFTFPVFVFTAAMPVGLAVASLNIFFQIKEEILNFLQNNKSKKNKINSNNQGVLL